MRRAWAAVPGLVLCALAESAGAQFWAVGQLDGERLRCLDQAPAAHVVLMACGRECGPIPWQLDERDAHGRLALDRGPEPSFDDPPDRIDSNDEILWMGEDAGRRMRVEERPVGAICAVEIEQVRLGDGGTHWLYAFVLNQEAPRSGEAYVSYDASRDVISGARVSLGFGGPTPQYLAIHRSAASQSDGNLLDRLKVRVSARFLGLIPVGRDEGHLTTELVAWRAGPIRVIRRQRQWAYVGFGLRSPTFGSDTQFYRDFAELPVTLRLNFPPTYFFRGIEVRAALDFRDLRGWELWAEGLSKPVVIGSATKNDIEQLNAINGEWFALAGPEITLVQTLGVSRSLDSLSRTLYYRETADAEEPEAIAGEMPAVGYRLVDWNGVGSGRHAFWSTNYALPPGYDLHRFLRERAAALQVESRQIE